MTKFAPKEIFVRYMSRDENGKRKYTWAAGHTRKTFDKNYKHLVEFKYRPEGKLYRMTKADVVMEKLALSLRAIKWKEMGKELIVPSLVAGPVIGAGITAATSHSKQEFKKNITTGIGAGIAADALTGAALGLWGQRKLWMK